MPPISADALFETVRELPVVGVERRRRIVAVVALVVVVAVVAVTTIVAVSIH